MNRCDSNKTHSAMKKIPLFTLLVSLLFAAVGCKSVATNDGAKPAENKSAIQDLRGSWQIVSEEVNGKKVSDEEMNREAPVRLVFQEGTGSIRNADEVLDEFTFNIDPAKTPKALDLTLVKGSGYFKPFEGMKSLAIYEINGDTLKACWTLFDAKRERPAEFATAPDSGLLLVAYKRDKQ
jgi:uncharacterized protein (TIGR03067 family)